MLGVLLSSEVKAEQKRQMLQNEFNIPMTQTLESEVSLMCNLSKGVEEKALARGLEKALETSIKNLMESMNWTAEQAMDALKIPKADQKKYADKIKN